MSISIDQRKFLADAAQSLSSSSPSTAAYLLATHTHLLHQESKPLTSRQREQYCGACGSIRQTQWTKRTEIKPRKTATWSSGATVYKCLRCHRRTVNAHKKAAPTKAIPRAVTATASLSSGAATPVGASPSQTSPASSSDPADTRPSNATDNASSKKRAKARKQGGLQALLASKSRSQPSSSLDLLDFLNQA
jgi:ribonuclease MRP protein subunit SNM1